MTTTFSLKQGETRTSHGPIPHPLKMQKFKLENLIKNPEMKTLTDELMIITLLSVAILPFFNGKKIMPT